MAKGKEETKELALANQLGEGDVKEILALAKQDMTGWEEIAGEYWKPEIGNTYAVIFTGFDNRVLEADGEEVECATIITEDGANRCTASTVLMSKFKTACEKRKPPFLALVYFEKEVESSDKKKGKYQSFRVSVK